MASVLGMLLAGIVAFWVYQDAEKRGMNAIVWAIFTFLILIIGLPAYLISRKPIVEYHDDDIIDR